MRVLVAEDNEINALLTRTLLTRLGHLPVMAESGGMALQRCPEVTAAFVELGHEIACHGWRWIHYQNIDETTEREHMRLCLQAIEQLTGQPRGVGDGGDVEEEIGGAAERGVNDHRVADRGNGILLADALDAGDFLDPGRMGQAGQGHRDGGQPDLGPGQRRGR